MSAGSSVRRGSGRGGVSTKRPGVTSTITGGIVLDDGGKAVPRVMSVLSVDDTIKLELEFRLVKD